MDDPRAMCVAEAARDVDHGAARLLGIEHRPSREERLERLAVDPLHGEEEPAALRRLRCASTRAVPRGESADDRLPSAPVNAILQKVFGLEAALIGRLPMPFGVSLVAVVRRPA
jgi:hypothetical protein